MREKSLPMEIVDAAQQNCAELYPARKQGPACLVELGQHGLGGREATLGGE